MAVAAWQQTVTWTNVELSMGSPESSFTKSAQRFNSQNQFENTPVKLLLRGQRTNSLCLPRDQVTESQCLI